MRRRMCEALHPWICVPGFPGSRPGTVRPGKAKRTAKTNAYTFPGRVVPRRPGNTKKPNEINAFPASRCFLSKERVSIGNAHLTRVDEVANCDAIRDGRDDGDGRGLSLWSGKAVMPSRFVNPSTTTGKTGPSWRSSHTGGDSAALRHRPTRKQGLQGLRFAPGGVGQRAERRASAGVGGIVGTQKVRTSVRTGFAGLHTECAKGYPKAGHPCGMDVN